MNCKFCDREMFKHTPSEHSQATVAYDCFRCPRSVRFFYTNDQLDGYVIFINKKDRNLNDHLYAVVFYLDKGKAVLYYPHYGVGYPYNLGDFQRYPVVAEFGHVPNITPSNIHDKFKLYMLFS